MKKLLLIPLVLLFVLGGCVSVTVKEKDIFSRKTDCTFIANQFEQKLRDRNPKIWIDNTAHEYNKERNTCLYTHTTDSSRESIFVFYEIYDLNSEQLLYSISTGFSQIGQEEIKINVDSLDEFLEIRAELFKKFTLL